MRARKICMIGLDEAHDGILRLMRPNLRSIKAHRSYTSVNTDHTDKSFNRSKPSQESIIFMDSIVVYMRKIYLNLSWDIKYPRIFEILAMHGLKSIVINVPLTYPFEALVHRSKYIVVTDWASPKQVIWPHELYKKYKEFLVKPPLGIRLDYKNLARIIHKYLTTRLNLYFDLLERYNLGLFLIIFSEIDRIQHVVPGILKGENIALVKPILDNIKKFILSAHRICDATVLMSNHGFEIKHYYVSIDAFLHVKGFLKYKPMFKHKAFYSNFTRCITTTQYKEMLNTPSKGTFKVKILEKLIDNILNLVGEKYRIPSRLIECLPQILWYKSPIVLTKDIDSSIAYTLKACSWDIYVRDKRYLHQVKTELQHLPGVKRVILTNEVFSGPYTERTPDIILIPKEGIHIVGLPETLITKVHEANHSTKGIFIPTEDEFGTDINYGFIKPYDTVPIILSILGLPLPRHAEEKPLKIVREITYTTSMNKYDHFMKFRIMRKSKLII